MHKTHPASTRQHGFTLLETIIALVILAISLGVIYQIFGSTLRNTRIAEEYAVAQVYAQSHLSQLGKTQSLAEGITQGRYNGTYRWELAVEPQGNGESAFGIRKYKILLRVLWDNNGRSRSIEIPTLRLAGERFG